VASLARACSVQTSAGFSVVSGGTAGLVADAADEAWWMSKYPNWDDAGGCCAGGLVGVEGGAETRAGGVDGLDEGAEAGAGAGAASEAGAGWVSGTDSSRARR